MLLQTGIAEPMTSAVELPAHAHLFHYNLTAGMTRDGFSSSVNVFNYYCEQMSAEAESDAVADVMFYDEDGALGFHVMRKLAPGASLHIDIAESLKAADHRGETLGTAYTRLIPLKVPASLQGKRVSTECTGEIVTPTGARDFIHNLGAPVYRPNVSRMECGLMFAGPEANPKYIILVNNYLGPRLPFVSRGFAMIGIANHRGQTRRLRSETVPARGARLFSIEQAFPDLEAFLEGKAGKLSFHAANLAWKSWVWFGPKSGWNDITIEHM
jgi:hypothetical protein